MSKVELESFFKSFALFFTSLGVLAGILFYISYTKNVQTLDEKLFTQMRLCSFDLKCKKFSIDFLEKNQQKLYTLYKNDNGLRSYYPIPNSQKYIMMIKFLQNDYKRELRKLQNSELLGFLVVLGVIFILSILFSIYALSPLRNALLLTQEFIKDILHDFNTPLSTLRLNSSMLKKEIGSNEKLLRIEQSVQNILNLQEHLRSYLFNHEMQKEKFQLHTVVNEQVCMLEKNYPDIKFGINIQELTLYTNKKAFERIINNILSNAAKYNKKDGSVSIVYDANIKSLYITDTGKGIKNPQKIFERFYKEQERGIGIGLHIVKKLCDELGITISVSSAQGVGTTFKLNLSALIL